MTISRVYGKKPTREDYAFECKECGKKYVGKSFLKDNRCVVCFIEEDQDKNRQDAREKANEKEKEIAYEVTKKTNYGRCD